MLYYIPLYSQGPSLLPSTSILSYSQGRSLLPLTYLILFLGFVPGANYVYLTTFDTYLILFSWFSPYCLLAHYFSIRLYIIFRVYPWCLLSHFFFSLVEYIPYLQDPSPNAFNTFFLPDRAYLNAFCTHVVLTS